MTVEHACRRNENIHLRIENFRNVRSGRKSKVIKGKKPFFKKFFYDFNLSVVSMPWFKAYTDSFIYIFFDSHGRAFILFQFFI